MRKLSPGMEELGKSISRLENAGSMAMTQGAGALHADLSYT